MAFAFNAALIKSEEEPDKPKVSKENLSQLFKPALDKTKDSPCEIANIHAHLKEENEEELAQFYHKEVTPAPIKPFEPKENPLLIKMNHILELLEQQKEIKTNQKNEEIVLYCFLGLFILYIIDSFVSIGKYSR
jgi:hypothetical protein